MRTLVLRLPALLTTALLLTACSGHDASGAPSTTPATPPSASLSAQPSETPSAGTPSGSPTGTASTAPIGSPSTAQSTVSLDISGGFAGIKSGIEVTPDGSVRVSGRDGVRSARDLTTAEQDNLNSLLAQVDFEALPDQSIDKNSADRLIYRLQYDGHTLVTDKSEDLGPVDEVIDQLAAYLHDRD